MKSEEDLKVFLDYALKMLLYIPASYITKPAPKVCQANCGPAPPCANIKTRGFFLSQ